MSSASIWIIKKQGMFKKRGWYADIGIIQNTVEFHASYLRIHGTFHLVSTCSVLWYRCIHCTLNWWRISHMIWDLLSSFSGFCSNFGAIVIELVALFSKLVYSVIFCSWNGYSINISLFHPACLFRNGVACTICMWTLSSVNIFL